METRPNQNKINFLLKMFLGLFLSSALAVGLLLLLTSRETVNLQPIGDNNPSVNMTTSQLHLASQQLVDLKDFQFTINNNICGRRPISIAH